MNRRQLKVRRKGQIRCPLCRTGIRPDDADLHTCPSCDTILLEIALWLIAGLFS